MRDRRATMSWFLVVVVAIRISNRLLMDDWVGHRDRDRDRVDLRRVTNVDRRLVVGVVVASVRGGVVVVGRVVVVWVVVVWVVVSWGVGD